MRIEDYLHDVTLVGDDHSQLSAHKLVLSACSEYFREIFTRNKHSNTLLCLEGLSKQDITNVLDYMYNGEVHIFQEDIDRFLSIAERLRLEGLLESESKTNEEKFTQETKDYIGVQLSQQPYEEKPSTSLDLLPTKNIFITNTDDNEVESMIENNLEQLEGGHFRCKVCGKDSKGMTKTKAGDIKPNMKNHVETYIEGLSYSCQLCGKKFRSKNSFSVHKSVYHKNK